MSLFGQQPAQAGGGLFGTSNTNTSTNTQTPSGGLFGSTTNNTANNNATGQVGGLFGNAGGNAGGGGLFGSTNPNTSTQTQGGGLFGGSNTQQQQPSGGGLFGSTNAQQQPSGGLFGSTNNTNTQQPSGSLFGSTNANTQQPTTGGGLFGTSSTTTNANANANQPPTLSLNTGGGLFGTSNLNTTNTNNTNNAAPSTSTNPLFGNKPPGSLFGSTSTAPAASSNPNPSNPLFNGGGGGLFGSTNTNQQQQPAAGGLFGGTNTQQNQQQPTGGGLFGSANNNNQQQQPTGGLFGGQNQQQQQPKPASSLFGSTAGNNPLTTSALGPTANNQGGGGLFGNSTNNLSSTARGVGGEADVQSQFVALQKRIEGIAGAWNSQSSECQFQHYFYNLVDPAQVSLYGRPPNATNEALWQKAVRENPDRSCLVPVVAVGFDDLRQRVDAQGQQAAAHAEKLKELKSRIEALSQRHAISNATRLSRAHSTQIQITHRLLKLIQHLHLLIPVLRSSAIRPEEEALRARLEEIEEEVRRGRLRGKLNELWAVVGALLNGARGGRDGKEGGGTEWAVVDEEGLGQIAQILSEQQAGLQHLTKVLQRDLKDLGVIQGKSEEEYNSQGGDGHAASDSFFSSTSTLRASALR